LTLETAWHAAEWQTSWRGAGGIVAILRKRGDYLDFYGNPSVGVAEGTVADDVAAELKALGWTGRKWPDEP